MIEFTEFDPYSHRIEDWKTLVMLDQVTHVREVEDRGRVFTQICFYFDKRISVRETLAEVERRIRAYAETAQKERIAALVADEIAKQFLEMADKAWRYDESSK